MGAGKKETISGYNYWGSFALVICHGLVEKLWSIKNGDTIVWSGPVDNTSADADGKTELTTTIGQITIYWGFDDQEIDPLLEALLIDLGSGPEVVPMSAYRNICYAVLEDVAFGGQTTPPTLNFHMERYSTGLSLGTHQISGDAIIPEVIYELLTNTFYGAGISADDIDIASFNAAGATIVAESLGFSPEIDSTDSLREALGKMLNCIDGYLYFEDGKIFMGLNRAASTVGIPDLTEADCLDEPEPSNSQFEDTWNKTIVGFKDRSNEWEETSEGYDDPANADIVGETIEKSFAFPWLTTRTAAKKIAARLGIKGGIPLATLELKLKPSWKSLQVGDLFNFTYAALAIDSLCRVKRISVGPPSSPDVSITAVIESNRASTNDYAPGADTFTIPTAVDEDGNDTFDLVDTTPRLSILPTDLKDGKLDGLLVALDRPTSSTNGGSIYWTYDPGASAYKLIGSVTTFPAKGTLIGFRKTDTTWILRVELDTDHDADWLESLRNDSIELFAVTGQRIVKTVGTPADQHQVMASWARVVPGGEYTPIDVNLIEIEVEGGEYSTDDWLLETAADDAIYPTTHIYFGRLEDFFIYPSNGIHFERTGGNAVDDTDEVRYLKTPVSNHLSSQDLTDVDAVTYDRDLTTMHPDGTYSRTWGDRAQSLYELFDEQAGLQVEGSAAPDYDYIEDVDIAMGAIIEGTATADQIALCEHLDEVLGFMLDQGILYYNDSL